MLITLKNKDTLKIDDYILKCSIGSNGITSKKKEGDKSTPRGVFTLGKLYYSVFSLILIQILMFIFL